MKNQVYSWRLDAELKRALEDAARNEDTTIAGLLEGIVTDWLQRQSANEDDAEVQRQLHLSASKCAGSVSGGDPNRAKNASRNVRERLKRIRAG